MNKKQEEVCNNLEDLYSFYNRFLGLDNDEELLKSIAIRKAQEFIDGKDNKLNNLDKEYLSLASFRELKINDDLSVTIDNNAKILFFKFNDSSVYLRGMLNLYIGKSLFDVDISYQGDAIRNYINSILQNIFVSKMYKLILSIVRIKSTDDLAISFAIKYRDELVFEEKISDEIKSKFVELGMDRLVRTSDR